MTLKRENICDHEMQLSVLCVDAYLRTPVTFPFSFHPFKYYHQLIKLVICNSLCLNLFNTKNKKALNGLYGHSKMTLSIRWTFSAQFYYQLLYHVENLHFLSISVKRYENRIDMIAMNEKPMNIPSVPPTELISPRKSNNRYSS